MNPIRHRRYPRSQPAKSQSQCRWETQLCSRCRKKNPRLRIFTPPDPAIEFPHSENASLFKRLKENARHGIPGVMGGYKAAAHRDLIEILYDLIPDSAVRKGYAFGRPVVGYANRAFVRIYRRHSLRLLETARAKRRSAQRWRPFRSNLRGELARVSPRRPHRSS